MLQGMGNQRRAQQYCAQKRENVRDLSILENKLGDEGVEHQKAAHQRSDEQRAGSTSLGLERFGQMLVGHEKRETPMGVSSSGNQPLCNLAVKSAGLQNPGRTGTLPERVTILSHT